jgi:hypothetical protein
MDCRPIEFVDSTALAAGRVLKWRKLDQKQAYAKPSSTSHAEQAEAPAVRKAPAIPQRSSNTYSCCAFLMVSVRLDPEPTTNSKPITPGGSGDEGNCAIGVFAAGYLAFPLAKIKDRRSA